jgi:hypothetical protein
MLDHQALNSLRTQPYLLLFNYKNRCKNTLVLRLNVKCSCSRVDTGRATRHTVTLTDRRGSSTAQRLNTILPSPIHPDTVRILLNLVIFLPFYTDEQPPQHDIICKDSVRTSQTKQRISIMEVNGRMLYRGRRPFAVGITRST